MYPTLKYSCGGPQTRNIPALESMSKIKVSIP